MKTLREKYVDMMKVRLMVTSKLRKLTHSCEWTLPMKICRAKLSLNSYRM